MANVAQLTTAEYTARFNDQMSAGAKAATDSVNRLADVMETMDRKVRQSSSSFAAMESRLDAGVRLARAKAAADERLTRDTEALNVAVARGLTTQENANRLLQNATQQRDAYIAKVQRQIAVEEQSRRAILESAAAAERAAEAQARAAETQARVAQHVARARADEASARRPGDIQTTVNRYAGVQQPQSDDDRARRAADLEAYGRELDAVRARFVPLAAVQQAYERQVRDIANAERLGALSAAEAARAREIAHVRLQRQTAELSSTKDATIDLAGANDNAARGSGRFGQAMGQAGFQVQDFATQVAMGQNAMLAFGVQFAQFAGFFGTAGALAGAAVTVGLVAAQFLGLTGAADTLGAAVQAIDETYRRMNDAAERRIRGAQDEVEAVLRLGAAYAQLSRNGRAAEGINLGRQQDSLGLEAGRLRARLGDTLSSSASRQVFPRGASNDLGEDLGLATTPPQFRALREAMDGVAASSGDVQQRLRDVAAEADVLARAGGRGAASFVALRSGALDLLPEAARLDDAQRSLVTQTIALMQAQGASQAEIARYAGKFGALGTEIMGAAAALAHLRRMATNDPLAAMEQEFAQVEAQLRALRSGGLAELERVRGAQDDNARAVDASNRVYEEQLRLLREQGVAQADAEKQAGEAARAALDLMTRRNAAARQLSDAEKAAEDARRAAAQAATDQGRQAAAARRDEATAAREAARDRAQFEREAEREAQRERERQVQAQRAAYDEIANAGRRAFEQVGDTIVEAFVKGEQSSIRFGNVVRGIAASLLQTFLRLSVVNPATNAIFGTSAPTLGMAMGGASAAGGAAGGMGGLAGLGGIGAGVSGFLARPMWGGQTASTAQAGMFAEASPASMGISPAAGAAMAGGAPSWGQGLGAAAGGFAVGSSLGMLTARGSSARQSNGMMGAGIGAAAGMAAAMLIPGIGPALALAMPFLGGAAGGALGGLFGPGNARSFGHVTVDAADGRLGVTDSGGKNFDSEEALRAARREIEQLNDRLSQQGFSLSGRTYLGSGVAGIEQFGSIGESTALSLSAGDARVDGAVARSGGGSLDRQLATAERAQAFADQLDQMTNAIKDQTNPLAGIVRQFDEMRKTADRIGFGWEQIAEAQARAVAEFERTRYRANEDMSVEFAGRAAGSNRSAQLATAQRALDIAQQRERQDFERQARALGMNDEWIANLRPELERALAVEAAAMVRAWEDLWRAQREAVQALAVRATRAQAAASGSAVDAQRADLQAFDLRAAAEIVDTRQALLDLGLAADAVDAQIQGLIATHQLERRAIIAAYDARRQAIAASLDDRLFALTNDASTVAGALAAYDRRANQERIDAAKEGLTDLVQLEAVHAAERGQIIEDFAKRAAESIRALGGSIRQFLDGLRTNAALASPQDRFAAAQDQFGRDLSLARGGNEEALSRITGTADTLLTAGRDMFASGPQFQALLTMVQSSLEALPATKNYDALILAELQGLREGIQIGVNVDVIRIISETLNALPAADRDRLVQTGTVTRLVEERLGRPLTSAELAMVVQQGLVTRTVTQTIQTPTGAQLITAENITRQIAIGFDYAVREQFAYLHNLADIRMFLGHIRDMARGGAGGLRVTTYQASGAANDDFATITHNSPARNLLPATIGGTMGNFGGLQEGGWVGNGTWNRDSVLAGYAGGGQIMLAGGEHVTNAMQAARYAPELNAINAGTFRQGGGAAVVQELRALRSELVAYRRQSAGETVALRTELQEMKAELADLRGAQRRMAAA